jgi:hypothetical protein
MSAQRSRGRVANTDAEIDRSLTRLYVLYGTSLGVAPRLISWIASMVGESVLAACRPLGFSSACRARATWSPSTLLLGPKDSVSPPAATGLSSNSAKLCGFLRDNGRPRPEGLRFFSPGYGARCQTCFHVPAHKAKRLYGDISAVAPKFGVNFSHQRVRHCLKRLCRDGQARIGCQGSWYH